MQSLQWPSRARHTSRVRAWRGAKGGTIRRRQWHAGGNRMGCGVLAVIHRHAVSGTMAPHSTVPMPSVWSKACPCARGKYGPGRPFSFHRTQTAPACRLRSRAPGDWGGGKVVLMAWVAWARVPVGKYQSGGTQGSGSGFASLASHFRPGGAAGTVPFCRKGRAILSGRRWRVAARLSPSTAGATRRSPLGLRKANPGRLAKCGGLGCNKFFENLSVSISNSLPSDLKACLFE